MDRNFLEQIAGRWKTPFYLFNTELAGEQIRKLRSAVGEHVGICYAMKANPFLVADLSEDADFFEVCSPGEFRICERAGISMEKIVLSGVNKEEDDMERIVGTYKDRITYTAESVRQWEILRSCAERNGVRIRVLLRLASGSQFGMDEDIIRRLVSGHEKEKNIRIEGIQLFSGTQKKAPGKFEREFRRLSSLLSDLREKYGFIPQKLEYGPGLPVRYFEEEEDAAERMLQALADGLSGLNYDGKIVLEAGRFLAASCGVYVTEIADLKSNQGQRYCIADGGIHHISYYGQMMAMKKPPVLQWRRDRGILPQPQETEKGAAETEMTDRKKEQGSPEGQAEFSEWNICGSLCTINDVLVKNFPLYDLRLKDRLIFGNAGAYAVTEGLSLFLSRDLPQVIVYSETEGFRIARRHIAADRLNWFCAGSEAPRGDIGDDAGEDMTAEK